MENLRKSFFLRKEVIQPQVLLRLPCYDFTPIMSHTLGACSPFGGLAPTTSGTTHFRGVTGGVYKARERIHRAVADARLLAIPPSRSRVADFDPNCDRFSGFAPPHRVAPLWTDHCSTCVAQDVRAMMI